MMTVNSKVISFFTLFALFCMTNALAENGSMILDNIALGKKAEFMTNPGYGLTRSDDDEMQLTDGNYVRQNAIWHTKEAVGWVNVPAGQFIIDLGEVMPIRGFAVDTVGGGNQSGVFLPTEINVLVSDDGKNFRPAWSIRPTEYVVEDGLIRKKFMTTDLKVKGRYVFFELLIQSGNTAFCDEVEVYAGSGGPEYSTPETESVDIVDYCLDRKNGMSRKAFFCKSKDVEDRDSQRVWFSEKEPKILFMVPYWNKTPYTLRDYMNFDGTAVQGFNKFRGKELSAIVLKWIDSELEKDWDGIVLRFDLRMDINANYFSAIWKKVIAKVKNGTGLLLITERAEDNEKIKKWLSSVQANESPDSKAAFAHTIPPLPGGLDFWPAKKQDKHLYSCGKGKIVWLSELPRCLNTTMPWLKEQKYYTDNLISDYYFSFLSRALCLSLGLNTECGVSELKLNNEGKCFLTFAKAPKTEKIELRFWDKYRKQCYGTSELNIKNSAGKKNFEVQGPALPSGEILADVLSKNSTGQFTGWECFSVEKPGDVKIISLKPDKELYSIGDDVNFNIKTENKGKEEEVSVAVNLQDNFGRIIATENKTIELKPGENSMDLTIVMPESPTVINHLDVSLNNNKILSDAKCSFTIKFRPDKAEDFKFLAWYWGAERYFTKSAKKMGLDTLLVSCRDPFYTQMVRMDNVEPFYENIHREAPQKHGELTRTPCLTDSKYLSKVEKKVRQAAEQGSKFNVIDYSYGDEPYLVSSKYWQPGLRDICHSPTCLAKFREWLKKNYKDLDSLNKSWGSSFKNWDEVTPLTFAEAKEKTLPASWIDHRVFMDKVWIDYHANLVDIVEKIDPDARFGFSGLEMPINYDVASMMKKIRHLTVYPSALLYQLPSFARPGSSIGQFLGYDYTDSNEMKAKSSFWTLLALGYNSATYWLFISSEPHCTLLYPSGVWSKKAKWLAGELGIIKAGLGKLIVNSERVNTGLAVYYSPISWWRMNFDKIGNYRVNYENWPRFLTDNGFQYYYVTPEEAENGKLKDYKLLILPWASCMANEEVEAVEQFVKKGGTAVADVEFALCNEHGVPLEQRKNSAVFGVSQKDRPEFIPATLNVEKISPVVNLGKGPFTVSKLQEGTSALTAKALAVDSEKQAVFTQKLGEGHSVYMNFTMEDFGSTTATGVAGETEKRDEKTGAAVQRLRRVVKGILDSVELNEPVRLSQRGGDYLPITKGIFSNGKAYYLVGVSDVSGKFMVKKVDESRKFPFELTAKQKWHIYDSRNGDYLGYRDRVPVNIVLGKGFCYSFLPWRLEKITLDMPEQVKQGEKLSVKICLEGVEDDDSAHAVQFKVTDADGENSEVYSKVYYFKGNSFKLELPVAYNEKTGDWKVSVTDAATKISASRTFKIQSRTCR